MLVGVLGVRGGNGVPARCLVAQSASGSTESGFWCAPPGWSPWASNMLANTSEPTQYLRSFANAILPNFSIIFYLVDIHTQGIKVGGF